MPFNTNLLGSFAGAFMTTAVVFVAAAIVSFLWGAVLFFVGLGGLGRPGRLAVEAYVQLFRNIPVLLPIYLVYFGLPSVGLLLPASVCGVFALALQQGAYIREILRGSANAIERAQHDAALSIGISRLTTFRKVVLPQIMAYSLPALGSQAVLLLKDTSLLSAIAIVELMMQARLVVESTGTAYVPFVMAALLYLAQVLILDLGFGFASSRVRWR